MDAKDPNAPPDANLQVLVIGAGAVGQVYGRHAQLGGADLTFFVRAKYQDAIARGLVVYPLNRSRKRRALAVRFDGYTVVSTAAAVAARRFDQVYITVSSPALRGPWLAELLAACGDATIIALQPGRGDRELILAAGASADRLVSGMITLISYSAPLPGETRFATPGMAYWFPPMAPAPFSGPADRVAAVVALMKRGKLPAKRDRDVPRAVAFPSAIMMAYLVALENAGWSFRALAKDGIQLGGRGAREALAIVGHSEGKVPFTMRMVARPRVLRMGLWFARRVIPLPLEIYLREHFTKVGEQTREFVAGYIARGRAAGLTTEALEQMTAVLPAKRDTHAA